MSQPNRIKKKFLDQNSVDGTKVLYSNDEAFRAKSAAGQELDLFKLNAQDELELLKLPKTDIMPTADDDIVTKGYVDGEVDAERIAREAEDETFLKLDGSRAMMSDLDMDDYKVKNLADPTAEKDAANKGYVDGIVEAEAAAREAEDIRLQGEIDAEKLRAMGAEDALDAKVADEEERAIAEEQQLQTQISAEVLRAEAEEIRIQGEVDAEEERALAAESALSVRINNEVSRATSKEAEIEASVATKVPLSYIGAANGVAPLGADQKIPSQYIPAVAITDVFVVTTIAERDALVPASVQTGDIVKVTEAVTSSSGTKLPRSYVYDGTQFIELNSESDVDSVNGFVGHIVLSTADIAEQGDSRYYTAAREQAAKDYADAAVAVEEQARMAEDALIRAEFAAADVVVLQDAKDYTDEKVAEEAGYRAAEDALIRSEFAAADAVVLQEARDYTDEKVAEEAGFRIAEDLTFLKLDGSRPMTGSIDMNHNSISRIGSLYTGEFFASNSDQSAQVEIRPGEISFTGTANVIFDPASANSTIDGALALNLREVEDPELGWQSFGQINGVLGISGSQSIQISADYLDLNSTQIKNLSDPTDAQDAATRYFVEQFVGQEFQTNVTGRLGQANGIATLDASGKLSYSQIPEIAIGRVYVVNTIEDRDALVAGTYPGVPEGIQSGDVAKVIQAVQSADGEWQSRTYLWAVSLMAMPPSQMGSWVEITSEGDVMSVAGKTGHVTLDTGDVSEKVGGPLYFTDERAKDAAVVDSIMGDEHDMAPSVHAAKAYVDAEKERALAAESALKAEIDSFRPKTAVIVLSSYDIANNYVETPLVGELVPQSTVVFVDRLFLAEDDDYVLSIVNDKIRITFGDSFAAGGEEAAEAGDRLVIKYWTIVQSDISPVPGSI